MRTLTPTAVATACLLGIPWGLIPAQPASGSLWRNPVFQKSLLGSFGMNLETEPPLSDEERAVFDEIAPMAGEKPAEAMAALEKGLKKWFKEQGIDLE